MLKARFTAIKPHRSNSTHNNLNWLMKGDYMWAALGSGEDLHWFRLSKAMVLLTVYIR